MLPKLKPLKIKDRLSVLFVERGLLDVLDDAFVVVDKQGVRIHIPIGSVTCLMLEPGARISHSAVVLAARVGCLFIWVGEGCGVPRTRGDEPRTYLTDRGTECCGRPDRHEFQLYMALNDIDHTRTKARHCQGKTPMQTFMSNLDLAKGRCTITSRRPPDNGDLN